MATKEENDRRIKRLLSKVEKESAELLTKRCSLVTNGVFPSPRCGKTEHNLNTVNEVETLVQWLSFLIQEHESSKRAAEILSVDDFIFTWGGYTLEEWKEDFKLRAGRIQSAIRRRSLKKAKEKLSGLVSEETRTEMRLDELEAII